MKTPMTLLKTTVWCALAAGVLAPETGRAMEGGTEVPAAELIQTGAVRLRSLETPARDFCSGTLLDEEWILTAAHCLKYAVPDGAASHHTYSEPDFDTTSIQDVIPVDWNGVRRWIGVGWMADDVTTADLSRDPMLVGLRENGAIDEAFGDLGFATLEAPPEITDPKLSGELTAVVTHPSQGQRFVAVGRVTYDGDDHMMVLRFRDDGTIDTSPWTLQGQRKQGFPQVEGVARAAAFLDGGLIVAGTVVDAAGHEHWQAVRYHATGPDEDEPDPAFAHFTAGIDGSLADMVLAGNRLVWLGTNRGTHVLVVTDGLGHVVATAPVPSYVGTPSRLVYDPASAGVYVIGELPPTGRISVARRNVADLAASPGWPSAGALSMPIIDRIAQGGAPRKIAVRDAYRAADGRLVVAAEVQNWLGEQNLTLVRFTAAGAPDPSFGQTGTWFVEYGPQYQIHAIAADAQHRILLAGNNHQTEHAPATRRSWSMLLGPNAAEPMFDVVDGNGAALGVVEVHAHPVPGVDVALIKVREAPAMPAPGVAPFQGHLTAAPLGTAPITCYGSGRSHLNASNAARPLRKGVFYDDGFSGFDLRLVSHTTGFNRGDSGGACFVVQGDTSRLVGVISSTRLDPYETNFTDTSLNFVVDPARFAPWITTTTGIPLAP